MDEAPQRPPSTLTYLFPPKKNADGTSTPIDIMDFPANCDVKYVENLLSRGHFVLKGRRGLDSIKAMKRVRFQKNGHGIVNRRREAR